MDECAKLLKSDDRIIVSTTNSSCTAKALRELSRDVLILDEAAQASEPDALQPLSLLERNGQVVQIGDHMQLPATVLSGRNKELGLDRSMFERLFDLPGMASVTLREQHRMHPSIVAYPNAQFYNGLLLSRTMSTKPPRGFPWPTNEPLAFVQCRDGYEEADGNSFFNEMEADKVVSIISGLIAGGDVSAEEIFALSPYRPQVRLLATKLRDKGMGRVIVQTVEKSQGDQNIVVVLSTVRCNTRGSYGFVGDERRLNVAMTRAQRGLIIVGDERTLAAVDPCNVWTPFFREFARRKLIVGRNAPVTTSQDRRQQDRVRAHVEVTRKTATFSRLSFKAVTLSVVDAAKVLENARCIGTRLRCSSLFRFYLHYCLAMHPHRYKMENYPSDVRLFDRKCGAILQFFIAASFHRTPRISYTGSA